MKQLKRRIGKILKKALKPPDKPKGDTPVPPTDIPLGTEVIPPPPQRTQKQHCKPDSTPTAKWILDGATLIVTSIGIYVFWGQWTASRTANDINAANFRAGQRAWIGPNFRPPVIEMPNDLPVKWSVLLRNYGSSPAIEVHIHSRIYITGPSPNFKRVQADIESLPLATSQEIQIFNGGDAPNVGASERVLTSLERDLIISGKEVVVLGGRVSYKDEFYESHETTFCVIYTPASPTNPEGLAGCPINTKAT
jgi:hypothetical protein